MKKFLTVVALLFALSVNASAHFLSDLGDGFTAVNAPDYDTKGRLRPFVEITFPSRCFSTDDTFNRCTSEALLKWLGREAFDGGDPKFMISTKVYDGLPPHFYAELSGGDYCVHVINLVHSPADQRLIGVAVLITK